MQSINELIARIELQAESSHTDDRPTLASQAKSLEMNIGGKVYTKPCGGSGVCTNVLCTHPNVDSKLAIAESGSAM